MTYSILKVNPKTESTLKIKKNVIYNLFDSYFSLGSYTRIILYQKSQYLKVIEKENSEMLFSIYNEVSLSILKEEDQLSKKIFRIAKKKLRLIVNQVDTQNSPAKRTSEITAAPAPTSIQN